MNKKNKILKSFSARLSLKFMIILTVAILALSTVFVVIIQHFIRREQTNELNMASKGICMMLEEGKNIEEEAARFPYYISYVVYEEESKTIYATNDPYIPFLKLTNGSSEFYFEKNFFIDGDLNILYVSNEMLTNGRKLIIQASLNMDMDSTTKILNILPKAEALAIIPILVISFLVSLFITKNTIKPVVKITNRAKSISSSNLDTLLPVGKNDDEIDNLAKTFNLLFKQLKLDFDQERQFTSDVSHELKTPVAVISGQSNLLLRWGKDDPEQLEKSLITIKKEAKSMQAIIDNLLEISRIENGRIKMEIVEVDIYEMFERLIDEFKIYSPKTQIENKGKKIILKADEEMIHQVLTVVMQNSVKFANENCNIILRAFEENGKIIIEEEDNGPGFEKKTLPHIFERFYRGDEAHNRSIGGSGLGLSIAKTIVTSLGGNISAFNSEKHGAVLRMEFI